MSQVSPRDYLSEAPLVTALFTDGEATDPGYVNIRDAKQGLLQSVRWQSEYLWRFFEPYADNEFLIELRRDFDARYWEMYLATTLILSGYSVTCPKPGPDVGILHRGQRIWFEATSPTCGDPKSPDYIAPPYEGDVPEEKIILRYLNSIADKHDRQYANWIKKGVVSETDAFVIALNPRAIPFDRWDCNPPRIIQAAYAAGAPYVVVDRKTHTAVETGYNLRDHILKAPKGDGQDRAKVSNGVFQRESYNTLSGLVCSRVDAANRRGEMGEDFQLAPNPNAKNPLPAEFRFRGPFFSAKMTEDGYEVSQR